MRNSIFLTLIFSIIIFISAFADEPPFYRDFSTSSANGKYFAKVYRDSLESKWKLEVFNSDSTLLWERNYQHCGYESTTLSNDGTCFIYIEHWFRDNTPVVSIYQEDTILYLNGSEFEISESDLIPSLSHKIWCESNSLQDSILKIETKDSRHHGVNIYSGKLVTDSKSILSGYFKYGLILFVITIVIGYRVRRKKTSELA